MIIICYYLTIFRINSGITLRHTEIFGNNKIIQKNTLTTVTLNALYNYIFSQYFSLHKVLWVHCCMATCCNKQLQIDIMNYVPKAVKRFVRINVLSNDNKCDKYCSLNLCRHKQLSKRLICNIAHDLLLRYSPSQNNYPRILPIHVIIHVIIQAEIQVKKLLHYFPDHSFK